MMKIQKHFEDGFKNALSEREDTGRRIGAELKFPLVNDDGSAVDYPTIERLWQYLTGHGWEPVIDSVSGAITGARKPGEQNHTVASCETGYCKTEFSLAHVKDIESLEHSISELRDELHDFTCEEDVHFLGYGIHPVTPPGEKLLMKKSRTSVWDKVFASNEHIPEDQGDDFHLFTVNAASHVHVSVEQDEAIPLVNVLNGFCPAQIALTAHSNVWRGGLDHDYKCVAEKFWDWWMPEEGRVGMPEKPFENLRDYVSTISDFQPVYVKRDGQPLVLADYDGFAQYYGEETAVGRDADGREVEIQPEACDIDLHGTCYWYNARLSHYYTVENRLNDQQPPGELSSIAALTLGLTAVMREAHEEIMSYPWERLREAREEACRHAIQGEMEGLELTDLAERMLELAREGLQRRDRGEERYLAPLHERLAQHRCPADEVEEIFEKDGIEGIVHARSLHAY